MGKLANTSPKPGRVYTCKVALLIEDDEDQAKVDELMSLPRHEMSDRAIAHWMGVSEATVTKHRFGACVCARG